MPNEKLPTDFTRTESGSLRVQIRLKGHQPIVKNFALAADGAAERKRQLAEARWWATETRRRLMAGAHVSSREAERTTLGDALRRYDAEGLSGEEANLKVERYRIQIVLKDPIAQRPVAFLGEKDVAAFRDRIVRSGWRKKVDAAVLRLTKEQYHSLNDLDCIFRNGWRWWSICFRLTGKALILRLTPRLLHR